MAATKKTSGKSKSSASSRNSSKGRTASKTQTSKRKNTKNQSQREGMSPRVKAILYAAACVVSAMLLLIQGGLVWGFFRSVLFGIFGVASIGLPAFLGYMAYITTKERTLFKESVKMWLVAAIVFVLDCFFYLFSSEQFLETGFFTAMKNLYMQSASSATIFTCRGGILSGLLGYPMLQNMGYVPTILI